LPARLDDVGASVATLRGWIAEIAGGGCSQLTGDVGADSAGSGAGGRDDEEDARQRV